MASAALLAASMFLQAMTTLAPLFDKSLAVSKPMPVLQPVMTTVLPSNRASLVHLAPAAQFRKK